MSLITPAASRAVVDPCSVGRSANIYYSWSSVTVYIYTECTARPDGYLSTNFLELSRSWSYSNNLPKILIGSNDCILHIDTIYIKWSDTCRSRQFYAVSSKTSNTFVSVRSCFVRLLHFIAVSWYFKTMALRRFFKDPHKIFVLQKHSTSNYSSTYWFFITIWARKGSMQYIRTRVSLPH